MAYSCHPCGESLLQLQANTCSVGLQRADFNELVMSEMADAAQTDLFLAQVPLLSKLDPNKRLQLAKVMREREFKDGEFIVQAGEAGETMYIIIDGITVVTRSDTASA